jgi:hypothetical protein
MRARARMQPHAGRIGVHAEYGPGLRWRQPVAADQPEQFPVLRPQGRHRGRQPRREPRRIDRGLDRLGLVGIQRRESLQAADEPLPAREGAALVRQHPPRDAEQPRDGVPVSVTAAAAEPRRRTKRAEERFAHDVRDVTGVGASRDGVAEHPLFVTAIETAERLGVTPGRGLQQVRIGLVHACYLPAGGRAFQAAPGLPICAVSR